MPPSFLNRPVELLTADGRFESVADGAGWRRPVVLLSRPLCSFEFYVPPAGVGAAGAAAARLRARATAPFEDPAWLVRRSGEGYAIWWWDKAQIGPWLQDRFGSATASVFPETLAQPMGGGWRIVRSTDGSEAQYWKGGGLVSSAWQRDPFDPSSWSAFTRVQRLATERAPSRPPPAVRLPLTNAPSRVLDLEAPTPEGGLRLAAGTAVAAVAAFALFSLGQGLRLQALAAADAREATALRAAAPASSAARDRAAALRIIAFRRLAGRPDVLAALGSALPIAKLYGAEPQAFDVDSSSLTLTLPYSAIASVDRIAAELEATGRFADPRPTTDPAAQTIELRMRLVAAQVPPGG